MKPPADVLTVARSLGALRERVVFVGGVVQGLLASDPAAPPPRPTKDVDVIVDVGTRVEMAALGEQLRARGFREANEEGAPICRWIVAEVRVDVMPLDPAVLGFSNVWYPDSFANATTIETGEGPIRVIDPPHFCATKLEAFASRGGRDFYHHDLEDVIALFDRRPELVSEIDGSHDEVRDYLAHAIATLLADASFVEALPGHLEGDTASQARVPTVLARLQQVARLSSQEPSEPPPQSSRQPRPFPASAPATSLVPIAASALVRSSNLHAVAYDQASSVLTIEFRSGSVYEYYDVPATVYAGLLGAASVGRYHHRWIRRRYRYKRIR